MEASAERQQRARSIAVAAAGAFVCAGIALIAWRVIVGPTRVVGVQPGARLLAVSRGTISWFGRTCSVWQAQLDGRRAVEPLEPVLPLGACPLDDPRFDGDVFYHLAGMGWITRNHLGQRRVMVERQLAFALALDGHDLYVGNCAQRENCQIERMPAEDDPGDPLLIQAGILHLANMAVDAREIFWVDRGRRKRDCSDQYYDDSDPPVLRCKEPMPPRLMAAAKGEPRASERVVLSEFDGNRPLLGARHVYWLGAGGVHRIPKEGGANQLVLPTRGLTGFAADGNDVFFAADAGIFHARDGDEVRPLQSMGKPPSGLAADSGYVYWIDPAANAVVRRRE